MPIESSARLRLVVAIATFASGCAGCSSLDPNDPPKTSAFVSRTEGPTTARRAPEVEAAPRVELAPTVAPVPKVDGAALHEPTSDELSAYAWLDANTPVRRLVDAIPPPDGFVRVIEKPGSFGAWLRDLPLRAPFSPVKAYTGSTLHEGDDPRISAVAEIDVGTADLQQCADSVIRMHAEWMWSRGQKDQIGYHFLNGDFASWERYERGERATADGAKIVWSVKAKPSDTHATFRKYLDLVFNYASTISLAQHGETVAKADITPGDFFIQPGGPGHAVLVLDVATRADGHKVALLGQGYMPAQDFQVLHPRDGASAWFSLDGDAVDTPFWDPFPWSALHRLSIGAGARARHR